MAYEGLAADPICVARGVVDHLGIELPVGTLITPHRWQGDDINSDWIVCFRT